MVRYYLKGKEITKDKAEKIIKSDTIKGYKKHKPVISIHDYFQTIDNKGLPGRQTWPACSADRPKFKINVKFYKFAVTKNVYHRNSGWRKRNILQSGLRNDRNL